MTEPVKRYNLRQNMPATATTFLPDVVVSATDYARLEQEYAELVERYGKLQTGEGHITHRVIAERDAALKQVDRLRAHLKLLPEGMPHAGAYVVSNGRQLWVCVDEAQ